MNRITAWRITAPEYAETAFSGTGARKYGGRFNSPGTPLVYTADSLALAILELLVRVNVRRRVAESICMPVSFPESLVTVYEENDLPEDWDSRPYEESGQQVGDTWIESGQSLVLKVPSVVVPLEYNFLINPEHPEVDRLVVGDPISLPVDPRLHGELASS